MATSQRFARSKYCDDFFFDTMLNIVDILECHFDYLAGKQLVNLVKAHINCNALSD